MTDIDKLRGEVVRLREASGFTLDKADDRHIAYCAPPLKPWSRPWGQRTSPHGFRRVTPKI